MTNALAKELARKPAPTSRAASTAPRLRHFLREVGDHVVRYHLRVDLDGAGILLCNASSAVRLSASGVEIAGGLLDERTPEDVALRLVRSFDALSYDTAIRDVRRVQEVMSAMGLPSSAFPLSSLGAADATLHRRVLSAPLAADLSVPDAGRAKQLLRRLWDVGVPQVTLVLPFGAPAAHLVQLVEAAEDLGMIAGVRARATDIARGTLLDELAAAGVDHVDVYWTGTLGEVHDGLFGQGDHALAREVFARCQALEVCPVAVVPMLDDTMETVTEIGESLTAQRVPAIIAFAIVNDAGEGQILAKTQLPQLATTLTEVAERHDLNLVWAPPVERDLSMTLAEQARGGLRASGEACVRIEPDGSVLAPIGARAPAGNLHRDAWDTIWSNAAFEHWRTSVDDPPRCAMCPGLALCDAGCPADESTWARAGRAR